MPVPITLNMMEYSRDRLAQKAYKITGHHPVTFVGTARLDDPIRKWGSGSLYLDGDSDYVWAADHADWDFGNGEFTVDFWVKFNSVAANMTFVDQFFDVRAWSIGYETASGLFWRGSTDGTNVDMDCTRAWSPSTNVWYHIAAVRSGNNIKLFVSGAQLGANEDVTGQTVFNSNEQLWIGCAHTGAGGDTPSIFLNGHMDELRISKGTARWTTGFTPPTGPYTSDADTKLLLHFEGLLLDDGDTGHTITPVATAGTTGVFDEHLWLDGDSDYLSIPDSADWDVVANNADNWTIDFWVRHTDHAGVERYITQKQAGVDNRWIFHHEHGVGISFYLIDGGVAKFGSGGGEITDSSWHHVAMCKVGNEYGLYLDGIQTVYIQDDDVLAIAGNLYIGQDGAGGGYFYGQMDDIRINHSNIFSAAPVVGLTDTITVPTSPHQIDTDTKLLLHCDGLDNATHAPDSSRFEPYSEDIIKTEGDTSLKSFAEATNAINDAIMKVITPTINLSDLPKIKLDAYCSRTGTNIQAQFKNQPDVNTKLMLSFDGFNGEKETLDRCASPKRHSPITFGVTAQLDTAEKKWGTASLMLDGDSDYLSLPNSRDWDVVGASNDDWTIDFFVKHDDHLGDEVYLEQREDANNWWIIVHRHGSGLIFEAYSGGAYLMSTGWGDEIADSNWHHIALCKVGSKYACYLDGVQGNYADNSDTDNFVGSLFIGMEGGGVSYFDGHLDEIRIHHSNIFDADPQLDLSDTITEPTGEHTPDANTKLLLHLNGADEAQVTDDAAFGHEITFAGTTVISNAQRKWGGTSILFDGDSDYLSSPDSEDWDIFGNNADNWTIDFWVRHTDHDGIEMYLGQKNVGSDIYWHLYHQDGNGLRLNVYDGAASVILLAGGGEITDSNWHHIALIKVGQEYGIYKDGTQINYTSDASTQTVAAVLEIGAQNSAAYFNGHIEELHIIHSNIFNANPADAFGNGEDPDTIDVPTVPYDRQTYNIVIAGAGAWEEEVWDISGIANADKAKVDRLAFEIIEATNDNLFYLDNVRAGTFIYLLTLEENLAMLESLPVLDRGLALEENLALLEDLPEILKILLLEESLALKESETADVNALLTESLGLLESLPTLERALTLDESLALLEALTEETRALTLQESLALLESLVGEERALTLDEALALLESLPTLERALTLEENLALKEKLAEFGFILEESLALLEDLPILERGLTLSEALALLESETADVSSVLTESLALKEDLTQLGRALTLEESLALLEDAHAETVLFAVDKDGNVTFMGIMDGGKVRHAVYM